MTDLTGIDLHHGTLPSHMKIDIWEEYARVVLNWLEPADYSGLTTADKPDLVDEANDLGVEVTWSLPEGSQEIDALYLRLCTEKDSKRRSYIEERLSQLGAKVNKYVCLHPTGHDDFLLIHKSHEAKLELLNKGGYRPFRHNHLFVMSDILADETMLQAALIGFRRASTNYKHSFERIIVAVPGYVYKFNLVNFSYHVTTLPSSKQYDLAMTARSNVLNAEMT
ncbi:MAG TPA: hypothetical protein IAA19_07465 [Candidatus Olsenella pullistercoris]|uniref:Uncharacterized protein n=1 Tax=Candidatus Olsenella pullistercoris TaxID=2838712 RepID=A0A9D2JEH5_9ACTN|nr:hypothetical protein [Candidatus Olsenella pullistercoris]